METPTRDRLKKKLKKKKEALTGIPVLDEEENDTDIFKMISQVQSILKTNPSLVNKVSSCVNNLMSNPEIMRQLSTQIEKEIIHEAVQQPIQDTCEINSSVVDRDAVSK